MLGQSAPKREAVTWYHWPVAMSTAKMLIGYERNGGNYYFFNDVPFPRGYAYYTGPDLVKLGGTYSAPLFYPDWSIGSLLYIKRVAANGFYDYGKVGDWPYRSTGAELVFDVAVFHWPAIRVGVREAYRIDFGNPRMNVFLAFGWLHKSRFERYWTNARPAHAPVA
jgi:hypothetical protein